MRLEKYGNLKSAHMFIKGGVIRDIADDMFRRPENVKDLTREEMKHRGIGEPDRDQVLDELDEAGHMRNIDEIADRCGRRNETTDDAVTCMVDAGVPKTTAVGIANLSLIHAEDRLEASSLIDF